MHAGDTAPPDLLWEQPDTTSVAILAHNGNILMVGNSGFGGTVRLHEVSPSGMIVRSKTLPGFGYISELMELPDGSLFIGGGCPSFQVSVDSINVSPGATYNTYLACLAPDWTGRWMRYWEDVSCHNVHLAYSEHPQWDGPYIFMAGPNYLPFSIDSLSHAGANTSGEDFFLMAFDKAGHVHWIEEIPGNQGFSRFGLPARHALVAEGENLYLLGRHYGTDMYWGLIRWVPAGPLEVGRRSTVLPRCCTFTCRPMDKGVLPPCLIRICTKPWSSKPGAFLAMPTPRPWWREAPGAPTTPWSMSTIQTVWACRAGPFPMNPGLLQSQSGRPDSF